MALFGGKKKTGESGGKSQPAAERAGKAPSPSSAPAQSAAGGRPSGAASATPSAELRSPLAETAEMKRSETLAGATGRKPGGAEASTTGSTEKPEKGRAAEAAASKGGSVATIGKSIIIKGELTGDEDIVIDGTIEGDVKLPSHQLTIGAHGKVTAEVNAKSVQVTGHVKGNVSASERVEIEASGIVEGDISAPRLLVQEGAVVNGAIRMTKGAEAGKPAAKPQSSGASQPGQGGQGQDQARKAG